MNPRMAHQALHSQGEFDVGAAQPGDQVAFQEDADAEWVLGRVLSWMHETGQYEVSAYAVGYLRFDRLYTGRYEVSAYPVGYFGL